ncbi:MAG: hypothetical protein PHY77_00865 [Desulfotomaculaceae bacterium]|nr:hypothetical protein [Desulfotomaculaceae bacterium]
MSEKKGPVSYLSIIDLPAVSPRTATNSPSLLSRLTPFKTP